MQAFFSLSYLEISEKQLVFFHCIQNAKFLLLYQFVDMHTIGNLLVLNNSGCVVYIKGTLYCRIVGDSIFLSHIMKRQKVSHHCIMKPNSLVKTLDFSCQICFKPHHRWWLNSTLIFLIWCLWPKLGCKRYSCWTDNRLRPSPYHHRFEETACEPQHWKNGICIVLLAWTRHKTLK